MVTKELNEEAIREDERRACAERFKARIELWQPAAPHMIEIKKSLLTDGVAAILEPPEKKEVPPEEEKE